MHWLGPVAKVFRITLRGVVWRTDAGARFGMGTGGALNAMSSLASAQLRPGSVVTTAGAAGAGIGDAGVTTAGVAGPPVGLPHTEPIGMRDAAVTTAGIAGPADEVKTPGGFVMLAVKG